MNLRYQETFCIIFLLCTSITLGEDFDFVPEANDDVEPIAAEPLKVDSQTKLIHPKASRRCLPTEGTIKLSLGLQSKNWKHVQASLKQRTISKLAEYFLVPEESFIVHNAKSAELHRMVEKALHHGKKPPQSGKSLGWIGFPVGCGEKMFPSAKETVRNLNTQLVEIRDLTGMDFGWWVIWKDKPTGTGKQTARIKRDVEDDDYNYDDYDDEETLDDDEGETTEVPHAHRHHHGSSETSTKNAHSVPTHATHKHTNKKSGHPVKHHSEHDAGGAVEHRKLVPLTTTTSTTIVPPKRKHSHGLYDQVKERSAKKHAADSAAHGQQKQQPAGGGHRGHTEAPAIAVTPPDLSESVSQLESTISKTIANNEQLKQEEEKLLARKAKHKHIDIERIVETELLIPELERLQDEVFRDDYVIEDVVKVPKFYDYTTREPEERLKPVVPGKAKDSSPMPPSVTVVPPSTTVRPPKTTTTNNPIAATSTVAQTTPGKVRTAAANEAKSTTITSTPVTVSTTTAPSLASSATTKELRAEVTPLVGRPDDASGIGIGIPPAVGLGPSALDATTTTLHRKKDTIIMATTSIPASIDGEPTTTTRTDAPAPVASFDLPTTTILTTIGTTTATGPRLASTSTATTATVSVVSYLPNKSSASATNTRSANIVASVPSVKNDDDATADTTTGDTRERWFESGEWKTPAAPSPSPLPSTTLMPSTTLKPSTTTAYESQWNSGMDVDANQLDEGADAKVGPSVDTEPPPSTASMGGSSTRSTAGDTNPAWTLLGQVVTTARSVPLTTARNQEMQPVQEEPRDRPEMPLGRLLDEGDASEDVEEREDSTEHDDDVDDDDDDEKDYFSQGVRITVLPPNLSPPATSRARDATEPAMTTLTPGPLDQLSTGRPTGMASSDIIASTDSPASAPTMTASSPTINTSTTTTTSAYNNPTTETANTTPTATTTTTTTTATTSSTSSTFTSSATTGDPTGDPSTTTLAPEPDTVATSTTLELQPSTTQRTVSSFTTPKQDNTATEKEVEYENYDEEYDDEEEEDDEGRGQEMTTVVPVSEPRNVPSSTERVPPSSTEPATSPSTTTPEATTPTSTTTTSTTSTTTTTTTTTTSTTPEPTTTTTTTTTEAATTTTTTEPPTTTTTTTTTQSTTELDEPTNLPPIIRNRIPKQAIIAGKVYSYQVPLETFYDNEDGNNLRLELLDGREQPLKHNSWIQFNEDTKEIYGLPLEKDVSKWPYKLRATDSGNLSVTETVDIAVQQHKSHRSVNHEISLAVRLNRKFPNNADWQIETIRGITTVLGDVTLGNVVVRDIRNSIQDPSLATFVYTNDTLPKDRCPEEKLDELVTLLTEQALNDALKPDITVKSVQGQQIAQCSKPTLPKVKPTQSISRNFPPQTRNQVDQLNATVGHLLVYKVPVDTFYDPEDGNDLKQKLLTTERHQLEPYHWLQFDTKNQEFYGVPRTSDIGRTEYLLMAEDRGGLTATDALVVVVNQHHKRDYSVLFELTLDITQEQFSTAQVQRRFIERLAQVFGDATTHYIKIHHIRPIHHTGQVQVSFFNTTLNRQHQRCPQEEIEGLRNILLHQDSTIRAKVRDILGQEFSLQNVSLVPLDNCQGFDTPHHATSEPEKALPPPISKDDYLLTFVLPTVIILIMLLFAFIIACVLYKRRLTGKMELGTDEERKSFRSKGIPVIFQDELDEKPEIGNKSPVILKDEKPPLLPPSYSSTNNDGEHDDLDEYVPPPAVVVGGRESRGKSPVTPSYRRPPPYVSP